jgi:hypothetical protein
MPRTARKAILPTATWSPGMAAVAGGGTGTTTTTRGRKGTRTRTATAHPSITGGQNFSVPRNVQVDARSAAFLENYIGFLHDQGLCSNPDAAYNTGVRLLAMNGGSIGNWK